MTSNLSSNTGVGRTETYGNFGGHRCAYQSGRRQPKQDPVRVRIAAPIVLSILIPFALLLAACAGGVDSGGIPSWLSDYPSDKAYYVGIGGSNTGNLAEDREKAAAAARADLAAQISTDVSAELSVSTRASTDGGLQESVSQTVNQSVEQNLKSVETVDSWFSPDQGAWVYVRLSKAVWAAIIQQETADLTLRANSMLTPVLAGSLTEAENLAALGRARAALLDSPWGYRVKDETFASGSFLIDQVDREISARSGALVATAAVNTNRIKFGSEITVSGRFTSKNSRGAGVLPIVVSRVEAGSYRYTTAADGSYSVTLEAGALDTGTMRFEVMVNLEEWGIPPGGFPVARAAVEFFVDPILLGLTVNSNAAPDLASIDDAVADWISELPLPAEIVGPGRGDLDLVFSWTVFDLPRLANLANAPFISQVGASITVSRRGNVVLAREIPAYKDGGLDWNQAHLRSARGLLKTISEDKDLPAQIVASFGL